MHGPSVRVRVTDKLEMGPNCSDGSMPVRTSCLVEAISSLVPSLYRTCCRPHASRSCRYLQAHMTPLSFMAQALPMHAGPSGPGVIAQPLSMPADFDSTAGACGW